MDRLRGPDTTCFRYPEPGGGAEQGICCPAGQGGCYPTGTPGEALICKGSQFEYACNGQCCITSIPGSRECCGGACCNGVCCPNDDICCHPGFGCGNGFCCPPGPGGGRPQCSPGGGCAPGERSCGGVCYNPDEQCCHVDTGQFQPFCDGDCCENSTCCGTFGGDICCSPDMPYCCLDPVFGIGGCNDSPCPD
ncbi:MAG: hypothetical protein ACRDJW_14850 [Thermomicrobiales bacterium]